ncbi:MULTISPECIES: ferritin-like domain-containing protein [unclassified Caballeronia]|uniref:ferritin-like domain-containing protein n=1 Tax=unclassified Caballeronia TaxID=2646786 RepID=UPI00285DB734|nr:MULTISPECIES: ferritin-like domain-containing protein [unclassified Caballeronia]MDR5751592.1 ferritin-like domain-containing protein [Caballeronia sp. LZ024]MDR5844268.1 ferritin-like domain-containing protein [Caballeronia sp. LZ031]
MHTDNTYVMPWRIEDIDLSRIDRHKAVSNEHLLLLLCACSFIESGTDLYTSNLSKYFNDDPEISAWLNNEWEPEEMQHGRALKTYIHHVWPEFDWDTAFSNFFAEYSLTCSMEDFEKKRALEMVARCVVETGTATLYRAINECSDEPVLKQITDNIRTDEVRHYKHFFRFFKKYNQIEGNGRMAVLGALMRRVLELKNEDSEIALRHVFAIRYPERVRDSAYNRELSSDVNKLVRRNLSADMCVKMLLKPLDLPARIQPGLLYPLAKITQHVFFR